MRLMFSICFTRMGNLNQIFNDQLKLDNFPWYYGLRDSQNFTDSSKMCSTICVELFHRFLNWENLLYDNFPSQEWRTHHIPKDNLRKQQGTNMGNFLTNQKPGFGHVTQYWFLIGQIWALECTYLVYMFAQTKIWPITTMFHMLSGAQNSLQIIWVQKII